jgi:hypothetical protein
MAKRQEDPLLKSIEAALSPGRFIGWRESSVFVADLEAVRQQIDAMVDDGAPARAVDLCELFIAACYEKAEELDGSDGEFGSFAGSGGQEAVMSGGGGESDGSGRSSRCRPGFARPGASIRGAAVISGTSTTCLRPCPDFEPCTRRG